MMITEATKEDRYIKVMFDMAKSFDKSETKHKKMIIQPVQLNTGSKEIMVFKPFFDNNLNEITNIDSYIEYNMNILFEDYHEVEDTDIDDFYSDEDFIKDLRKQEWFKSNYDMKKIIVHDFDKNIIIHNIPINDFKKN